MSKVLRLDNKDMLENPTITGLLANEEARDAYYESMDLAEAAKLVRDMRAYAKLTQLELANRIGTTQARVSQIETVTPGDRKDHRSYRDGPTYTVLKRIAYACNVQWPPPTHRNTKEMYENPLIHELLPTQESRSAFYESMYLAEAAKLVRDMRSHAKLKQIELAELIGVSQPRVSQLETVTNPVSNDKTTHRDGPTYTLLKRVARACGFQQLTLL
jgi:transcriptional regulator with XRE-family HTH domain